MDNLAPRKKITSKLQLNNIKQKHHSSPFLKVMSKKRGRGFLKIQSLCFWQKLGLWRSGCGTFKQTKSLKLYLTASQEMFFPRFIGSTFSWLFLAVEFKVLSPPDWARKGATAAKWTLKIKKFCHFFCFSKAMMMTMIILSRRTMMMFSLI